MTSGVTQLLPLATSEIDLPSAALRDLERVIKKRVRDLNGGG